MANPASHVNIVVPRSLRDRLAAARLHRGQAMHEVVEEALSLWEDGLRGAGLEPFAWGSASPKPVARGRRGGRRAGVSAG